MTAVAARGATLREPEATADRWLPWLRPHLPPTLIDEVAWRRLERATAEVPAGALVALEVRLAAGAAQVDLASKVGRPDHALWFAERCEREDQARYLRRWAADREAGRSERVPFLWLEFDLDGDERAIRRPLCIPRLRGPRRPEWVAGELFTALRGAPLPPPVRRQVERCVRAAAPEGRVGYAFDLRARGTEAVRLELIGLRIDGMAAYFERLDRPDLAAAVRLAEPWIGDAERFDVSHEVESEIGSRVGIEASFSGWPAADPRWATIADRLVAAGLCAPGKRDAALAYTGQQALPSDGRGARFLLRMPSHFKVVCHPERPAEAKFYLLFAPYRRGPDGRLLQRA